VWKLSKRNRKRQQSGGQAGLIKQKLSWLFTGIAFGAALGATAVAYEGDLPIPRLAQSHFASEETEKLPVQGPLILKRRGYTVAYDGSRKQPLWVYERLTSESLHGGATRPDRFSEDKDLPKHLRSTLADYKRSGFDRGHLAAAANHKKSRDEMEETFLLSNMSPQIGPSFNRLAWKNLEERVRNIVELSRYTDVISGPLYLPEGGEVRYRVIGPNDVAVPSHFFKVIIARRPGGREDREAWILPNREIRKDERLSSFAVSLEKIERLAGVVFK